MPALPNKQPVAARQNRISTSPTRKDSTSMSSHNNNIDKNGRQGASANFTSTRNPNSMYNAMSMVLGKELEQKAVEETKSKKAAQPIPRPLTPHGKGKNFIERNKQSVQAFPVSPVKPTHKKSKEEPQSVSPTPTLKKSAAVNPTTPNRPVTPGANGQSSARPQAKPEKKTKAASNRRPASPPASSAHSAHSRSHESAHHSAHSRSHVRAASPEISLREENKKLRRLLAERDDLLREKEAELLDAEDIVEAFQERVRQVEARNRELQKENELMRNHIEEELEKKKSSATEPTSIISSVMTNIQRIRGEPVSPISKPDSPTLDSKPVSPIPIVSPKYSPLLTTTKSKELMKANVKVKTPVSPPLQPRVVPKTRGNLIPANKVNDVQTPRSNDHHPPRPTAPSPAAMNRHEPSSFNNGGLKRTEMSDRHAEMSRDRQASDRKKAAALNVVMEESEDSEVDEFIFERDETSDDQADSEFDTTGTESENDDEYTSSGNTNVNDTENESDDDFDKWSTHASSKHTLNSIIEDEEEEEEDDEFDYEPQQQTRQQQKNWTPVNPIEPSNATVAQVASAGTATSQTNLSGIQKSDNSNNNKRLRRRLLNSIGSDSSDSGIGSAHEEHFDDNVLNSNNGQQISTVNNNVSTQKQMAKQHDNFSHRDSMSSIKSDSSDDSIISASSSHNDSYPSSVTSPSSADISPYSSFAQSIKSANSQQNLASSNGLYGQSTSNSDLSSSKMMSSGFACNPLSQLNNNGLNSSSYNNVNNVINSKRSISPNSANSTKNVSKQSNPRSTSPSTVSNRSTSPASSSRASTPSSNASTARAPSPASPSSSRASTPASESSRNASSNRRSRLNGNSTANSSSDKCQTAIPPPPPPPTNKDPFATLQHYLRLISENSVMENPLKSYDVNKVIDEGSSAKVYTANPLSNPSEECAIKIVPLSYSLEFIFNEIYVLKNLKHKNIVDFKESFLRWDGKTREVWIAMEKCARGDVTNRAGKVNQREVGRIAGELLSALKHLHANGIIHRDIKLSNILAGANNEIKLADFGISSLTPTSTTSMVGTIPYMAPDVVLVGPDRPYDTKVDIWSLGVCILELLTGKAAWGRIRDDEIMDKLRRGEMPYGFQRLRKKADIGWEAVDFLEKCFARTPENRWSAEKLLEHPFITGNRN